MKADMTGSISFLESEPMLSLCLRGKVWKYRGEGNANIVIALPQERLILRLHKWERDRVITSLNELEEEQRVWREVVFCRSVMVPLLGSAYIQPPKPARLGTEVVKQLDMALQPLRPSYRIHKGIKFCFVAIYPDYALLPFGFKNITDNMLYNHCNTKVQSLERMKCQNNYYWGDTSLPSRIIKKNVSVCAQKMRCYMDYKVEANRRENKNEGDIVFIENNRNVNETVHMPSLICKRKERSLSSFNQFITPLYISSKSRGPRRFSTGSDYNVILPPDADTREMSVSAPVYSQFIFDFEENKDAVFCVEIKPKQGWIPLMDRINPKCTFCLNQYLKLSKGLIESISEYCPLDLFSGDEVRMRNALRNLLATPQNNLKLFRDGVLVYSDNMGNDDLLPILVDWLKSPKNISPNKNLRKCCDKFCDLVLNALTTDLTAGESMPIIEDVLAPESSVKENYKIVRDIWPSSPIINSTTSLFDLSRSCDWTAQQLPSNCILDRILKIQKLEQSGADAVFNIFKEIYPEEKDYDYVNRLCDRPENVLRLDPVQRYLLATTAKDCSILISFQRIDLQDDSGKFKQAHVMKDSDGISYAWNVGISDLDPKPLLCIKKHRKRDADVLASYIDYFKNT